MSNLGWVILVAVAGVPVGVFLWLRLRNASGEPPPAPDRTARDSGTDRPDEVGGKREDEE